MFNPDLSKISPHKGTTIQSKKIKNAKKRQSRSQQGSQKKNP